MLTNYLLKVCTLSRHSLKLVISIAWSRVFYAFCHLHACTDNKLLDSCLRKLTQSYYLYKRRCKVYTFLCAFYRSTCVHSPSLIQIRDICHKEDAHHLSLTSHPFLSWCPLEFVSPCSKMSYDRPLDLSLQRQQKCWSISRTSLLTITRRNENENEQETSFLWPKFLADPRSLIFFNSM